MQSRASVLQMFVAEGRYARRLCACAQRRSRVAGIFVRFYTLRHSTFIFNALQRNLADFSTTHWFFHGAYKPKGTALS